MSYLTVNHQDTICKFENEQSTQVMNKNDLPPKNEEKDYLDNLVNISENNGGDEEEGGVKCENMNSSNNSLRFVVNTYDGVKSYAQSCIIS
jgi:hypothetical protein